MNANQREKWSRKRIMAWVRLSLAVVLGAIYFSKPHDVTFKTKQDPWGLVCGVFGVYFLLRSVVYFLLAPAIFHLWKHALVMFKKEKPEYPCPVCGYDIRMTPHRCPECGTKLRWGQLP